MKKIMMAVLTLTFFAIPVPVIAGDGGALLGAIAGGVLGNQVGDGNGRKIATVVGAVIGAGIGSRVQDGSTTAGEYTCVNCGGTTHTQQTQNVQYRSYGEEAAAHKGAADRKANEQQYLEQRAYCEQNPYGCARGRGFSSGSYGGHNGIVWR